MSGITLIVAGCREFMDAEFIEEKLLEYIEHTPVRRILHGGCRGVDTLVDSIAEKLGIERLAISANFDYGKIGGPARNYVLVNEGDALLAFWRPGCDGTQDIMTKAYAADMDVNRVDITNRPDFPDPF